MADPKVERWQQRGRIAIWRESQGRDLQWNISADEDGCESLVELFGLMENARWPSKVALELASLTATANGDATNFKFAKSLILVHPKDRVPDEHWLFLEDGSLSLEIGQQMLQEFRAAVIDIRTGNGDYAVGGDPNRLWVWWWIPQ